MRTSVRALLVCGMAGLLIGADRPEPPDGPPPKPEMGGVIPPFVRDGLKLTEAQEKKVAALEKDIKARLNKILTKEQIKLFEEALEKGPGEGPPGGPPEGQGPGGQQGQGPGGQGPGQGQQGRPGQGPGGQGPGQGQRPGGQGPGQGQQGRPGQGPGGQGPGQGQQGRPGGPPGRGQQGAQGGRGQQGGPPQGGQDGNQGGPGGNGPSLVIPPFVQLNLTQQQQKQISALDTYARTQLAKIFTKEQSSQFAELLRKGPGEMGPRGKGGPNVQLQIEDPKPGDK